MVNNGLRRCRPYTFPVTNSAGSRRRLDPDARRAQLVAAGLELAKVRPIDTVTAPEVARHAGVSKALVFHYFPTHRELQAAIARAGSNELIAMFESTDDSLSYEGRLEAGLRGFMAYIEEQRHSYTSLARGAGADELMAEVFEDTRQAVVDIICEVLGLDEPSPKLRLVLRGWIAMCEEMTLDWLQTEAMTRDQLTGFLRDAALACLSWAVVSPG